MLFNDPEADRGELLARLNQVLAQFVPHNRALALRLTDFAPGLAWMCLPYDEKLVGNVLTRVLHGGAISSLLDATSGAAVLMKLAKPERIATLDLRIDYLRPATPDQDVTCKADCYKVTRHVAFVRALAYHDDESDPIAAAAGSFMIFQRRGSGAPASERAVETQK
jgi:uncharacterized protein (TIGR00369 family)